MRKQITFLVYTITTQRNYLGSVVATTWDEAEKIAKSRWGCQDLYLKMCA